MYLVAKHPIHKCPLRGDFECWFARTIHSLVAFTEVFLEERKTTNYRKFISSSNDCIINRHCRVYRVVTLSAQLYASLSYFYSGLETSTSYF